ncbi:nuclear transport factor 2 family protein [soil metagenome]
MSLESITQASLDAYNAQDLDAYCGFFTDDIVVVDLGGAVTSEGMAAYRARYEGAFAKFPKNRANLVNRIVLGNTVIDHERVDRGDGETPVFEVAAIYTFRGDKIARVDFAK